jgi:DNA-binding SARP family transcriptional activator
MQDKSKAELSISTLGNFKVNKKNRSLNNLEKKASKRWQLFIYLVTNGGKTVSREKLITLLDLYNNSDPEGSLSALVYRLRNILKTDNKNREYIKTSGSAYTFNQKSDYWLDLEKIEQLINKCRNQADYNLDKAEQLYAKALDLYKGDYLEEFDSQEWIWNIRNKYQELLINSLLDLDPVFRNENEYLKLNNLYNQLQQKIKSDERLLENSIEILMEAGFLNSAKQKYEELKKIYKNNDLILPASVKDLEKKLTNNQTDAHSEVIPKNLDQNPEGAFICKDRMRFNDIFKLEKRRLKRDKTPRTLSHLKLKSELNNNELKYYAKKLLDILSNYLRAGDLVYHWQIKHFNLLLMDTNKDEAEKVIKRIRRLFNERYNDENKVNLIDNNFSLKNT